MKACTQLSKICNKVMMPRGVDNFFDESVPIKKKIQPLVRVLDRRF